MKKNQLYLVLVVSFIMSICSLSCNKNDSSKPDCKIVGATSGNNATSFTYDAEGRISSKNSSAGTDRFTYNGNTIKIASTAGGTVNTVKTITVNANGLASRVTTNDSAGKLLSDIVYEYNGTELSKETLTAPGRDTFITTHTYSNGNMISTKADANTTTFDYSANVPAQTGDLWNLLNLSQGYETIRTKNALTSTESGGSISTINYVFDAAKKITRLNNISNGVLVTLDYQYECH